MNDERPRRTETPWVGSPDLRRKADGPTASPNGSWPHDPPQPLTTPQIPFRMHSELHFGRIFQKRETQLTHWSSSVLLLRG